MLQTSDVQVLVESEVVTTPVSVLTKISQSLSPLNSVKYPIWPLGLSLGNI